MSAETLSSGAVVYHFSSDAAGPTPIDPASGDAATVNYPLKSFDPNVDRVVAIAASAKNSDPNVSAARLNNNFSYTAVAPAPNPGTYPLVIPDGKYTLGLLEENIAGQMLSNGHGTLTHRVFLFGGSKATNIATITIRDLGYSIDFTVANGLNDLLGFGAVVLGPPVVVPTVYSGTAQANFEQGVSMYRIHCDLVADSFGANGRYSTGFVTLEIPEGSLNEIVNYKNTLVSFSYALARPDVTTIRFHITDQADRPITLNGGVYSISLMVVPGKRKQKK